MNSQQTFTLLQANLHQQPDHIPSLVNLCILCITSLPPEQWEPLLAPLNELSLPPYSRFTLATYRTIAAWYTQPPPAWRPLHHQACEAQAQITSINLTCTTANEKTTLDLNDRTIRTFGNMFRSLTIQPDAPHDLTLSPLYMVGDSHTLPPHGQTVPWNGHPHRLTSRLVTGLKLWHLADPSDHSQRFRQRVLTTLHSLPPEAPVILSLGEIDTRPNEGIWQASVKQHKRLEDLTSTTITAATSWLKSNLPQGRQYALAGPPAPSLAYIKEFLSPETIPPYTTFVASLNQSLAQSATSAGIRFLDFHALTSGPENLATRLKMDTIHLMPCALAELLVKAN